MFGMANRFFGARMESAGKAAFYPEKKAGEAATVTARFHAYHTDRERDDARIKHLRAALIKRFRWR